MSDRLLERYADAWVRRDLESAAALLDPAVVVTESYGPVYDGVEVFRRWFTAWFDQGGVVHRWTLGSVRVGAGFEFAEWVFDCTWQGNRSAFEGCSIAEVAGGRIIRLREYATTAPRYEWTGAWRS